MAIAHCECSISATVGRVDCVISSTDKNFLVCADLTVFSFFSKSIDVSSSKILAGKFSMTLHSFFRRSLSAVVCFTS